MPDIKNLYETINTQKKAVKNFQPEIFTIPEYITNNLKHNFFDWQKDALENFLYYHNKKSELLKSPTHLMFNMATGTGKTLLMAATILYYYKKKYRHFLFFVNQRNIVDKTENNFIDSTHTKFLFTEKIIIDDGTVNIKQVDTFSDNPQGIEIKFTSIQKLYNDIHIERENQTTLEDLHSRDIVMLADEAHHLNTDTKRMQQRLFKREITARTSLMEIERNGWEHTVIELILNKNGKTEGNKNVLLEFTATIPETESIAKKYEDKIIYKFDLKEFLQRGYTKEINLISSSLDTKERVLQALLFQWYRHKIALKHGIANFKPVILFRSKTIEESKQDYEDFLAMVNNLKPRDFDFLSGIKGRIKNRSTENQNAYDQGNSRIIDLIELINSTNLSEIIQFIKGNFTERQCIITNSKSNTNRYEKTDQETEKLLNSLEDKNNHIRAIFTVNRLTEGWDVLNLFDIVRLYKGRDEGKDRSGNRKAGRATVSEVQLIGRGVRYFPFAYEDKIKNKRKFDQDLNHDLRVLEELYFHSISDHRYIDELKRELKKDGYIEESRKIKKFDLKEQFRDIDFYRNTLIWCNKQIDDPEKRKKTLKKLNTDLYGTFKIKSLELREQIVVLDKEKDDLEKLNLKQKERKTIPLKFRDIEKHIFLKAINIKAKQEGSMLQFEKLKEELEIDSIDDLLTDKFLGDFDLNIEVTKNMSWDDIGNKDKLEIVMSILDKVSLQLKESPTKIGGDFESKKFKDVFATPKTKIVHEDMGSEEIAKDMENADWYVLDSFYGTSEEQALIEFIKNHIGNLESKYEEVYLLRNEEVYKIYDFETGKGFQPDFLLFLKTKDKKDIGDGNKMKLHYQIFIEPKGNQFRDSKGAFTEGQEGWKEKFLEEIAERYGLNNIIKAQNPDYRLIGLPFFNKGHNKNFEEKYEQLVNN